MSGRSLLPLIRGHSEPAPRVVVNEGRLSRAAMWDKWRLVVHDAPLHPATQLEGGAPTQQLEDELYDLDEDPGERRNVARAHPDVVSEMRGRLIAALAHMPEPDAPRTPSTSLSTLRLRFAGAGQVHRVFGTLTVGDERHLATVVVQAAGIPDDAIRALAPRVDFDFTTSPEAAIGFDIHLRPAAAPIVWHLFLDGAPWPEDKTFAGSFGLKAVASRAGIAGFEARAEARAAALPVIDAMRDLGVFVAWDSADKTDETPVESPTENAEGMKEMQRVLQEWGYAHGSH